jgi:hypothetical protein
MPVMKTSNTIEFIEKSIKIHGHKYDYSSVKYIGVYNKIKIICKKHGEFLQLPHDHLLGKGCSICGRKRTVQSHKMNTDMFIKKAQKIHGKNIIIIKLYIKNLILNLLLCVKSMETFYKNPTII